MVDKSSFLITQPDEIGAGIAVDQALAKQIAAVLGKHYPGWPWAVNVDGRPGVGIVHIENWALSHSNGFTYKISQLQTEGEITRLAVAAGGEFLERHNLPRTYIPDGSYEELSARAFTK